MTFVRSLALSRGDTEPFDQSKLGPRVSIDQRIPAIATAAYWKIQANLRNPRDLFLIMKISSGLSERQRERQRKRRISSCIFVESTERINRRLEKLQGLGSAFPDSWHAKLGLSRNGNDSEEISSSSGMRDLLQSRRVLREGVVVSALTIATSRLSRNRPLRR